MSSTMINQKTIIASAALTLTLLSPHAVHAQTVTLRTLIPRTSDIEPNSVPALHNGVYAALGLRWSDFRNVLYGGRLSDPIGTPPTVIIESSDPIPNVPNEDFDFIRFPTVWNGAAYFSGASGVPSPAAGTYFRHIDGGPIQVLSDRYNNIGPWIEGPFAGTEGIVYINAGYTAGTGAGVSLYTYDQQWVPIAQYWDPMPDGSLLQSTSGGSVAIGGGKVVFSARVDTVSGSQRGVYLYDFATSQLNTVVNWKTPIPGDGRPMTVPASIDTDGTKVALGVGNGHLYFGGIAAVCVADADGSNLTLITKTGDPFPGLPGRTIFSVGKVAIDAGIVYFQATYQDGANERVSLLAHVNGNTIPIVHYDSVIDGFAGNFVWYDPRGVDGPDVVIELQLPSNIMGVSDYMLIHAHIDVANCDTIDFNNDASLFDPQDIEAFLSVYSEGSCVPASATCNDIDFNNDTSVFDPCDIGSFLSVYSEGPCTPCGE